MPAVNIKGIGRVNFPDSMSQEQIIAAIEDDIIPQYKAEHPENTNFFAPLQQGLVSAVQQVELGLGSLGRTDEETRAQAERNAAANKGANIKTTSWPDVKKAFGAGEHPPITLEEPGVTGVIPGLAEAAKFSKDAILQSFPAMGPIVAGAEVGGAAGMRSGGARGALVGGALGAVTAGVPQMLGSDIEAKIEAKTPGPLVTPGTVASAVGQSAFEATGVGYVLGKQLVSKIVGAPIKDVTEQNLLKAAKETVAGYALLPIKGAAVEGPVSVAQKVLERAQAGLPLTSPDAYEDYENEFAGGVAGGAPMRAASGIHDIRQAKKRPAGIQTPRKSQSPCGSNESGAGGRAEAARYNRRNGCSRARYGPSGNGKPRRGYYSPAARL